MKKRSSFIMMCAIGMVMIFSLTACSNRSAESVKEDSAEDTGSPENENPAAGGADSAEEGQTALKRQATLRRKKERHRPVTEQTALLFTSLFPMIGTTAMWK